MQAVRGGLPREVGRRRRDDRARNGKGRAIATLHRNRVLLAGELLRQALRHPAARVVKVDPVIPVGLRLDGECLWLSRGARHGRKLGRGSQRGLRLPNPKRDRVRKGPEGRGRGGLLQRRLRPPRRGPSAGAPPLERGVLPRMLEAAPPLRRRVVGVPAPLPFVQPRRHRLVSLGARVPRVALRRGGGGLGGLQADVRLRDHGLHPPCHAHRVVRPVLLPLRLLGDVCQRGGRLRVAPRLPEVLRQQHARPRGLFAHQWVEARHVLVCGARQPRA
mmetsp:Transcript_1003/g.3629  ORF Transcript_1003/g.3629 Transcript_1003/m.3629 type:complete len:275 (+) Transcript_1003:566-1390(+)